MRCHSFTTHSLHQLTISHRPHACGVHMQPCTVQTCRQYGGPAHKLLLHSTCFNFAESQSQVLSHLTSQSGSPSLFSKDKLQHVVCSLTLVRWLHAETAGHEGNREGRKDHYPPCADNPSVHKPFLWYGAESSRLKSKKSCCESLLKT